MDKKQSSEIACPHPAKFLEEIVDFEDVEDIKAGTILCVGCGMTVRAMTQTEVEAYKRQVKKQQEEAIPAEMTPEYWDRIENRKITAYGVRDEYGGL